ncbi:sugar ABC transporter permease [Cellulomonas sp. APG4]|uniref:carbohydrate ABC transporter permease n=1 Tax=Cellulomonas sp. APG4 TaxID=1538656 RepID=UPI00137B6307|nr:sugar ABC transporter permease [Cellulomonas sp. APG4]NCT92488.1 sugar ABC transporter permease [Cellulomonas sp. APG4]
MSLAQPPAVGASVPAAGAVRATTARRRPRRGSRRHRWLGWAFVAPALAIYAAYVLRPFAMSVQYSFYDWNGIGTATWAGLDNYREVFSDPDRLSALANSFKLIFFYSVLSIAIGLVAATLTRSLSSRWARAAQTALFLPQVVPLVGAGIAWTWLYASDGAINQILTAVGLGSLTRPWLADFDLALPAVGVVGTWVLVGLCTMLLSTGMAKIDPALYDAARVDGAGPVQEFFAVTLPGVRAELAVCLTVTLIAALASFDVIYVMTLGGPGGATMVPGVDIYQLAFNQSRVGAASAMAVVLMTLVLAVVVPLQHLVRERS